MNHLVSITALVCAFSASLPAQYASHKIDTVGIGVRAHKDLNPVPLRLGAKGLTNYTRGQFQPVSENKYILKDGTIFDWGMDVMEFGQSNKAVITGSGKKQSAKEKAFEEMMSSYRKKYQSKDFAEYVTKKDPLIRGRKFLTKGKVVKAKGKRPAYKFYEFYDVGQRHNARGNTENFYRWRHVACYTLEGREVVLYFHWPVFEKPKPDLKMRRVAKRMIESLTKLSAKAKGRTVVASSAAKDRYANTEERKKALSKALENIQNLKGWDYYTTPHYIVFFSWDGNAPAKKAKSVTFAKMIGKRMEQSYALYLKYYPAHEKLATYYPVLRICHSKDLFDTYGGTSGGVVGWFNSGSKELVIFNDQEAVYGGKKGVMATATHEGWHQYADAYFGGTRLHRWFDEGTGDWFGAWTRKGGWKYAPDRSRIGGPAGILLQVRRKKHVPLKDIISWNKDKFYGPRALYYYAQGYAMIDFLRRGKKMMRGKWDKSWDNILDDYRKTLLEEKDQEKALEVAFGKIDMDKLDTVFQEFVMKKISKK